MPSYDASDFDPPAPVAHVVLRHPDSGATLADVPLLLATGADVALLPRTVVERLGGPILPDQRDELMSFDGSQSVAPVVMLDLVVLRRAFRGRDLLIEAEHGILGRDILNHVTWLLDGPRQQWSEPSA